MVSVDRCVCDVCVGGWIVVLACVLALWLRWREAVRHGNGWMIALLQ